MRSKSYIIGLMKIILETIESEHHSCVEYIYMCGKLQMLYSIMVEDTPEDLRERIEAHCLPY